MTTKRAETAQELKEKYGRKRFTSANAGKALIYNQLYRGYQLNEGIPSDDVQSLYSDLEAIKAKVDNVEDANRYNVYLHLLEWTLSQFEAAIIMRNGVKSVVSAFYNTTGTILAGENLRRLISKEERNNAETDIWLRSITLWKYAPQDSGHYAITSQRENIESGLRYLNAYNTLIELIAAETDIPEYTLYKVDMQNVKDFMDALNDALDMIREDAEEHRAPEAISKEEKAAAMANLEADTAAFIASLDRFTPEYLAATLEAFKPISFEPEPIPDSKIKAAKDRLHYAMMQGRITWYNLFVFMTADYWRR